jgi:hypothetical protein
VFGDPYENGEKEMEIGDLTEKEVGPPGRHVSSHITGLRKASTATSRFKTS